MTPVHESVQTSPRRLARSNFGGVILRDVPPPAPAVPVQGNHTVALSLKRWRFIQTPAGSLLMAAGDGAVTLWSASEAACGAAWWRKERRFGSTERFVALSVRVALAISLHRSAGLVLVEVKLDAARDVVQCDEAEESKFESELDSFKVDVMARLDIMVCESVKSVRDFVGQVQLLASTHGDTKTVFIICVILLFLCFSVFFFPNVTVVLS